MNISLLALPVYFVGMMPHAWQVHRPSGMKSGQCAFPGPVIWQEANTSDWTLTALIKVARLGAICFLPTSKGKYLMQDDSYAPNYKKRLRPPGGGQEKVDGKDCKETIIRELGEEFALPEDKIRERLQFLGYTHQKRYWGTAVFLLKGHGLKPGVYQASNDPDEKVKLVEVTIDHPKYTGPVPSRCITPEAKKMGDKLLKSAYFPAHVDDLEGICNAMVKVAASMMTPTPSVHAPSPAGHPAESHLPGTHVEPPGVPIHPSLAKPNIEAMQRARLSPASSGSAQDLGSAPTLAEEAWPLAHEQPPISQGLGALPMGQLPAPTPLNHVPGAPSMAQSLGHSQEAPVTGALLMAAAKPSSSGYRAADRLAQDGRRAAAHLRGAWRAPYGVVAGAYALESFARRL